MKERLEELKQEALDEISKVEGLEVLNELR